MQVDTLYGNVKSERMKAAFAALMRDLMSGRPIRPAQEYLDGIRGNSSVSRLRNGADRRHDYPLGDTRRTRDARDQKSRIEAEANLEKLKEAASKGLPPLSEHALAGFRKKAPALDMPE